MAKKSEQVVETVPAFSTEPQAFSGSYSIYNYKSLSFFLERMGTLDAYKRIAEADLLSNLKSISEEA